MTAPITAREALEHAKQFIEEAVSLLVTKDPYTGLGITENQRHNQSAARTAIAKINRALAALSAAPAPVETGWQAPKIRVKPMRLSDGRTDFYVSVAVGDRETTPFMFRDEQYKAEYEAATLRWVLLGHPKPDIMAYRPDSWPLPPAPSTGEG